MKWKARFEFRSLGLLGITCHNATDQRVQAPRGLLFPPQDSSQMGGGGAVCSCVDTLTSKPNLYSQHFINSSLWPLVHPKVHIYLCSSPWEARLGKRLHCQAMEVSSELSGQDILGSQVPRAWSRTWGRIQLSVGMSPLLRLSHPVRKRTSGKGPGRAGPFKSVGLIPEFQARWRHGKTWLESSHNHSKNYI